MCDMRKVKYNEKCNGDVLISGAPKSGKVHCVSSIVLEALKAEKSVMWISEDDVSLYLEKIYDELTSMGKLFSKAYFYRKPAGEILSNNDITKICHNLDWNEIWPDIMVFSNVSFGDYEETGEKFEFFREYCRSHNILMIYAVQSDAEGRVPMTMLRDVDFSYEMNADGDVRFGEFRMNQVKKNEGKEDIFV